MQCVVEGVETLEQKEILEQIGCSIIQGFYYSKPVSLPDLMLYLSKFNEANKSTFLSPN
jgi:EAL domain-containing protein (putative c-di-GMP-specific phosphodiesterase class I)